MSVPFASAEVEKGGEHVEHVEHVEDTKSLDLNPTVDLAYDNEDDEPALHSRTYLALVALFVLNLVQVVALTGPPMIVGDTPDLSDSDRWITSAKSSTAQLSRHGFQTLSPSYKP